MYFIRIKILKRCQSVWYRAEDNQSKSSQDKLLASFLFPDLIKCNIVIYSNTNQISKVLQRIPFEYFNSKFMTLNDYRSIEIRQEICDNLWSNCLEFINKGVVYHNNSYKILNPNSNRSLNCRFMFYWPCSKTYWTIQIVFLLIMNQLQRHE